MANKEQYLRRLQILIEQLHKCGTAHQRTAEVHELVEGRTVWRGEVEVFDLHGHARAKRCYGWLHKDKEDDQEGRLITVLEIPPVSSPQTAVLANLARDMERAAPGGIMGQSPH